MSPLEIFNEIMFWVLWFLLLWNAYFLLFNRGVPNIKTSKTIRKKTIDIFKKHFQATNKKEFTIIDLGSGYGHFSRQMALTMPQAHIIGIEVNKISYWRAVLTARLKGIKNLSYINKDFHDVDLSVADAVYLFLLGTLMGKIRPKLEQDLKSGTLVCSNKFKIGGDWQPQEVIDISTIAPHQKTLYVYIKSETI